MTESRLEVLRRRLREELAAIRVYRLAGCNWREYSGYSGYEGASENAARCEAAKQIHGTHAVVLLRLMRDATSAG
jgi:hypothetical protein